jgi:hypothetical protein
MESSYFETPILFTVYNRPHYTEQVFAAIRGIGPRYLYVAADGPSQKRAEDEEKCRQVRKVLNRIDWPCELKTLFHEKHQGCRKAMSKNINWFFDHVSEGIILEDDCLPHPSFFGFCRELLEFYRDDERVMLICGDNKGTNVKSGGETYYFSRLVHIWGWATWRRAWAHFDADICTFPSFRDRGEIRNIFPDQALQAYWTNHFEDAYQGKVDTWDIQWVYSVFAQGGLSVMPRINLVTNIGFGRDATHTVSRDQADAFLESGDAGPIVHPKFVIPNNLADAHVALRINGIRAGGPKRFSMAPLFKRLGF